MMIRNFFVLLIAFTFQFPLVFSQLTEVECTVYRRSGAYITLTPAHFDISVLPKVGESVHLLLLVKSNLPPGKNEGYYELCKMQVIKVTPEIKSIIFKMDEDMESIKSKTGLPEITLTKDSKVRIGW